MHAIEKGASIVIVDEVKFKIEEFKSRGTIIKVKDTKEALADLARFYRKEVRYKGCWNNRVYGQNFN